MEIIVTGGRDYKNGETVAYILSILNPDLIVQGGARGADSIARNWALGNNVESITVEADWDRFGKGAGHIRNGEMLKQFPDAIVVAFPGGKGTENCVKQAKELGRIVLRVE